MQRIFSLAQTYAAIPGPGPILLLGETGVGKTNLAEHLHALQGKRAPFEHVICSTLGGPNTFATELFGTRKGTYGGTDSTPGRVGRADGGTSF